MPTAWRLYAAQHENRRKQTVDTDEAFKETYFHAGFTIQLVGVFYTVSYVGCISLPLRLFNLVQNSTILRGRHTSASTSAAASSAASSKTSSGATSSPANTCCRRGKLLIGEC